MKYTIISINDDRAEYKDYIRRTLQNHKECHLWCTDGKAVDLPQEIGGRGLRHNGWSNAKKGELGVWLSNYDAWWFAAALDEPLIIFEDDAIPDADFDEKLGNFMADLPEDWDFAALWVPENQRQDFFYDVKYNHNGHPAINGILSSEESLFKIPGARYASLVYQGYGMVSLMYSPKGAKRLVELAHEYGITGPVDCWIYEQAHMGNLKGYAPRPEQASIVHYDWKAVSHVQLTERHS